MTGAAGQQHAQRAVDHAAVFRALPTPYLVMTPDLVIADCNDAYLATVGRTREELVGRPVFEAFPPTEDALDEHGVPRVQVSFERARDTGQPDTMPLQKYDIPDGEGGLSERYWSLISVPVLDADGRTVLVVQRAEDVTDYVRERDQREAAARSGQAWQRRVEEVEADLYARAQELQAAIESEARVSRRLAGLAEVALALAGAESVEDLSRTVIGAGLAALGSDGGAIGVCDGDVLRLDVTESLGELARTEFAVLPIDSPLPACAAVRTGEPVLLPDRQAGLAYSAAMAAVYEATGRQAWVALPLRTGGRVLGSLTASWTEPQAFDAQELELLGAFAAQCAQALERLQVRAEQERAAAATRRLSETLQRSLLTDPPEPDHLEIAVRYQPAASEAQVGGDWYDAFLSPDGSTTLVIGDVTGHDRNAAAAMGQIRNVLRGVAQSLQQPPGRLLTALDRAMANLAVDVLASAALAQVHQTEQQAARSARTLRWSNAGHPPPLLMRPDGSTELLQRDPDLLLGLVPDAARGDHEVVLPAGSTVLLYTDGLVERRGESLDVGLERLRAAAAELAGGTLDELCDGLLALLDGEREDDVALVALRLHPEDRPRPPEAGPQLLPRGMS